MFKKLSIIVASLFFAASAYAQNPITGAGATFPFPLYSKWAADYNAATKNIINYQSVGSGAGIRQIQSRTVVFGATDMPLREAELTKSDLAQWPQTIGAIVVVINVDNIRSNQLVLDGPTLADIYLGKIRTWNAPAIQKLNPELKLPNTNITVVRRSDGSGTTFVFTNYLSKISADWKSKVGEGTAIEWPVGVGARGNEGVAGNVAQTKNSIGYVEYAYAKQNNLVYTRLINAAGKTVTAGVKSFGAAAEKADWTGTPGFAVILTDQPGDDSWPITAASFILMPYNPKDRNTSKAALEFFEWSFANGKKASEDLDFIPIPDNVVELIKSNVWSKIQH